MRAGVGVVGCLGVVLLLNAYSEAADVDASSDAVSVIIGNDGPSLEIAFEGAEACAHEIADALHAVNGSTLLLIGPQATLSGMKQALAKASGDAGEERDLLVFFAGLGVKGEGTGGRQYLVMADSDPRKLESTAFALDELIGLAAALPARQTFLVLDTCIGDGLPPPSFDVRRDVTIAYSGCQPVELGRSDSFTHDLAQRIKEGGTRDIRAMLGSLVSGVNGRPNGPPAILLELSSRPDVTTRVFPMFLESSSCHAVNKRQVFCLDKGFKVTNVMVQQHQGGGGSISTSHVPGKPECVEAAAETHPVRVLPHVCAASFIASEIRVDGRRISGNVSPDWRRIPGGF